MMSTTSSKISQFISRTGSSNKVAQELLKENHWNVDCAVNVYKLMNEVSMMPKKNSNKQNLVDVQSATSRHDFRATNKIKPATQEFCKNSSESITASYRNDAISYNRTKQQRVPDVQIRHSEAAQEPRNLPSDDISDSTFILPDFSTYPDDFRNFLDKDLIETSTLDLLMKAGRLNWWSDLGCQPLFPLVTTGDGNCLLHAASLALWGHQDTDLILRKRLFEMLNGIPHHDSFFRRWKWHQMQINKQSELVYSHQEWLEEWNSLIKLSSPQPRISPCNLETCQGLNQMSSVHQNEHTNGSQYDQQEIQYESLEELHIFVLAHLLKRPIIITADTILRDSGGEALAPITFGGVYLPLEHPPAVCHRFPILLTYDAAHFSALVPTEDSFQSSLVISRGSDGGRAFSGSVPLVDFNLDLLPVHFVRDPGPNYNWNEEKNDVCQPETKMSEDDLDDRCNGVNDDVAKSDEVTLAEKVAALKKYLDIEVVSVSPLANSFSSLDSGETGPTHDNSLEKLNGQSSVVDCSLENSDSRRVSESSRKERTSSDASDSTNARSEKNNMDHLISNDLFNEEKSKREKSKGLGKLKKIAKSVSANFKRSFNVKNSVKHTPNKSADVNSREKQTLCQKNVKSESPAGSPEPSNVVQFIVESLEKKMRIPCARLLYKRQDYQTEIIRNYLEQASERFLLTRKRELERIQVHPPHHHHPPEKSFEIFNRQQPPQQLQQQPSNTLKQTPAHSSSASMKTQTSPVQCINTGCNGRATSDTSYLCADCYEKQKSEEAKIKSNTTNNNNNVGNNNNNGTTIIPDETSDKKSLKINNCIRSKGIQESPLKAPQTTHKHNIVPALKSSISDDFRPGSSRIVLEKYTKVDNRMLVATETTEADFHTDKSGFETKPDLASKCKDSSGPDKFGPPVQTLSRNLPGVEEVERSNKSLKSGKCPTEGCPFYGSQLTDLYCSSCYKKKNVC